MGVGNSGTPDYRRHALLEIPSLSSSSVHLDKPSPGGDASEDSNAEQPFVTQSIRFIW
jgi:hypothetical protein